jgi:hypothetical protein
MKTAPGGFPLERQPASACSRLPGNHSPGQGGQKPRRRVHVPESLRRLARGHVSRVGRPQDGGNRIFRRIPRPVRACRVDAPLVRLEPDRCAIDPLGPGDGRARKGSSGVDAALVLLERSQPGAAAARWRDGKRTPVTLASPVPGS